jgi:hypothetical protein
MGSMYLGQILTGMIVGQPAPTATVVSLEPIKVGAWAAWAQAAPDEAAAAASGVGPETVTVPQPALQARRFRFAGGADR